MRPTCDFRNRAVLPVCSAMRQEERAGKARVAGSLAGASDRAVAVRDGINVLPYAR